MAIPWPKVSLGETGQSHMTAKINVKEASLRRVSSASLLRGLPRARALRIKAVSEKKARAHKEKSR